MIPELSVTNIKISLDFYVKLLGFKIKYEGHDTNFAFLEYEGNQIMLEEINDRWNTDKLKYPFGRGINLSLEVNDVDVIYNKLLANDYKVYEKMQINKYKQNAILSILSVLG